MRKLGIFAAVASWGLSMVSGSLRVLRLLPPLKLVAMIYSHLSKVFGNSTKNKS
jgi:hypothetical protein